MGDEWLTLAEAASRLGVSVRTIHRKAASGVLESTVREHRRFVKVDVPAGQEVVTPGRVGDMADKPSDRPLAFALEAFRQDRQDLRRARRWALVAWGLTFAALVTAAAAAWTVADRLAVNRERLAVATARAADLTVELAEARDDAAQSRQEAAGARIEAELAERTIEAAEARLRAAEAALADERHRRELPGWLRLFARKPIVISKAGPTTRPGA